MGIPLHMGSPIPPAEVPSEWRKQLGSSICVSVFLATDTVGPAASHLDDSTLKLGGKISLPFLGC